MTSKQQDPAAAPDTATGQGLSAFRRADLCTGVLNPAPENHTGVRSDKASRWRKHPVMAGDIAVISV